MTDIKKNLKNKSSMLNYNNFTLLSFYEIKFLSFEVTYHNPIKLTKNISGAVLNVDNSIRSV
jgi:hypothetical protein